MLVLPSFNFAKSSNFIFTSSELAVVDCKNIVTVAAATMILQSTPANADEANMKLEDFAMLANKDKEGIETIDIGEVND